MYVPTGRLPNNCLYSIDLKGTKKKDILGSFKACKLNIKTGPKKVKLEKMNLDKYKFGDR